MIEIESREDAIFRECMDYLRDQDIDHDIVCKVAGYFGGYGAEAWMRGLREGKRDGTDL